MSTVKAAPGLERYFPSSDVPLQRQSTALHLPSQWRNYLCHGRVNAKESIIMGDRSPKANQKKSTQKQSKFDSADQKKKQAVFAKQSANKKK
jgi:hypothetical protein